VEKTLRVVWALDKKSVLSSAEFGLCANAIQAVLVLGPLVHVRDQQGGEHDHHEQDGDHQEECGERDSDREGLNNTRSETRRWEERGERDGDQEGQNNTRSKIELDGQQKEEGDQHREQAR
jgi:hypothetical protein